MVHEQFQEEEGQQAYAGGGVTAAFFFGHDGACTMRRSRMERRDN
jgi:hypothetical protein